MYSGIRKVGKFFSFTPLIKLGFLPEIVSFGGITFTEKSNAFCLTDKQMLFTAKGRPQSILKLLVNNVNVKVFY